ncbi:hypothetical protein [Bradyrhizobium cenepequi]|uniref:hypothetical protein n=1 Tax=Bradyrhizobium cenepequi TaxID=2821403 RepID=UPI001CE2FB42|nr:hypothetical protein [Bradyrhizobium cenepequi]MCA6112521.1 hypothetical protein [Bradyrhizobium cenepequi]
MRSILVVLGLSIALSTSVDAATMHHSRTWHHLSPNVASSFNFAPSWGYERTAPSVHYEYVPPAYNDPGPNNLGGLVGGNPNGG